MTFSKDKSDSDPRLAELEELLKLTEASTSTIDTLLESIDKGRVQMMIGVLFGYFMGAAGVSGVLLFRDKGIPYDTPLFASILAMSAMGVVAGGLFIAAAFTKFRRNRKLRHDLSTEMDIHKKLISLLHDQLDRVAVKSDLSPVSQATIEIRIRRLERKYRTSEA